MATHSSIFVRIIPPTEEPGGCCLHGIAKTRLSNRARMHRVWWSWQIYVFSRELPLCVCCTSKCNLFLLSPQCSKASSAAWDPLHCLFIMFLGLHFLLLSRVTLCRFFKIDFIFQSSFRFTAELSGKYREFPYTFYPHTCIASTSIYTPHERGLFVTID